MRRKPWADIELPAPHKTLRRCHYMSLPPVGVQAKQIVTELVKKSSQLVSVGFWPSTALAVRFLILLIKRIFVQGVPWALRSRFTQFSEKGSELAGFGMDTPLWVQRLPRSSLSPDLDKFSLQVLCMKDIVRMSRRSKQNVHRSTNANRGAAECRTWRILPDNALQLT